MGGVTGDFGELTKLHKKLVKLAQPAARIALVRDIAEEYRDFMTECFRESRSPYGQGWAPLKFRTSDGGASQKPLLDTGLMRGAVTPLSITPDGFQVHVGRTYASTHQNGATIVARNAKALRFRGVTYVQRTSKSGRRRTSRKYGEWIFRKRVVIPARPFAPLNGMPPELDARVTATANEFLVDYFAN